MAGINTCALRTLGQADRGGTAMGRSFDIEELLRTASPATRREFLKRAARGLRWVGDSGGDTRRCER